MNKSVVGGGVKNKPCYISSSLLINSSRDIPKSRIALCHCCYAHRSRYFLVINVTAKQLGHFRLANQTAECWRGEFFLRDFPAAVPQIVPKCAQFKTGFDIYLKTFEEILHGRAIILAQAAPQSSPSDSECGFAAGTFSDMPRSRYIG